MRCSHQGRYRSRRWPRVGQSTREGLEWPVEDTAVPHGYSRPNLWQRFSFEQTISDMSDDPHKRGRADRERVNIHEEHELRSWSKTFGVSAQELTKAVQKVGPMVKDIRKELGR